MEDFEVDGNAVHLYKFIMTFLMRNLMRKQVEADFNSPGELEVLHRSSAADSPLRIFIFDNRIEIHSPGLLPQGITVEDATHGVSVPRNKLLFSNGIHLLPYTGAGSGLTRAQLYTPNIKFENDERLKEFVVTIWRESYEVGVEAGVEGEKHSERIPYAKLPGVQKNII